MVYGWATSLKWVSCHLGLWGSEFSPLSRRGQLRTPDHNGSGRGRANRNSLKHAFDVIFRSADSQPALKETPLATRHTLQLLCMDVCVCVPHRVCGIISSMGRAINIVLIIFFSAAAGCWLTAASAERFPTVALLPVNFAGPLQHNSDISPQQWHFFARGCETQDTCVRLTVLPFARHRRTACVTGRPLCWISIDAVLCNVRQVAVYVIVRAVKQLFCFNCS